jgi:hypothetical protein
MDSSEKTKEIKRPEGREGGETTPRGARHTTRNARKNTPPPPSPPRRPPPADSHGGNEKKHTVYTHTKIRTEMYSWDSRKCVAMVRRVARARGAARSWPRRAGVETAERRTRENI